MVAAYQRAAASDLPSSDQSVQEPAGVAAERLSFAKGKIRDPVPVHPVLRNPGVPAVEEQATTRVVVLGSNSGREIVGRPQDVVTPAVPSSTHGVAHHIENLETDALRVPALHLDLKA